MSTTLSQPKAEETINNPEQSLQDEQSTEGGARQQSSLYVGDLAKDVVENQLYELFSQVGPVLSLRICKDQVTKRSLGYGYVNYNSAIDPQAAQKALDNLNYKAINGKPIRIMWSNRDPQFRKSGVGNIFIKNLDKSIDNLELHDTFKQFGSILSCKVATDENGNSRGYGFVHFYNETDAKYAIENVNNMQIKGKTVYVGQFQKSFERANEQKIFTNIYVKNLKEGVTDEQLNEIFAQFGEVTSAVVAKDSGKVKGFGFVNFKQPEDAASAVNELHDRPHEKLTYPSIRLYTNRAEKKNEREAKLRQIRDDKINEVHQKTVGMNVYVKNLSDGMTNERLKSLFSRFGEITSAKIMTDQQQRSKGFGFVCFSNPDAAASSVVEMYGFMVDNKPLYVAHAQRKDVRRAQLSNFKKMQSMQMQNPINRQVPNYGATPAPMPFAPTSFMGYPQPLPGAAGRGMMPPYAYQAPMQPPTGGREGRLGGRGGLTGRGAPIPPQAQAMGAPMMGGMQQIPRGMGGRGGPMGYGRGRQNLNFRNSGRGFQGRGRGYQGGRRPMPYGRGGRNVMPQQVYNRNMVPNQLQAGQGMPPQNVQPTPLQKIQVNDQNNGNQGNQADLVQTLATKSEEEQKQVIGEKIYKQVQKAQPQQAGKITGMLLEMGVSEVLSLLESPSQLQERIDEAINVLKKANMYEPQSGQNGNVQPPQAQTA